MCSSVNQRIILNDKWRCKCGRKIIGRKSRSFV